MALTLTSLGPVKLGHFVAAWLPALAVTSVVDPAPRLADALLVSVGLIKLPLLTCGLGALGIVMARPLARKKEATQSRLTFWLVSVIMLLVVQLWIIEQRPGALFAFVIAIGLGFSGYSLIELLGDEIGIFLKRIVAIPAARLSDPAPAPTVETEDSPK